MKKTIIASAVLSVISFGAMAENPSFNYVEAGYTEYDFDGFDVDGFEIKASKELNDNFYIGGDWTQLSESGVDLDLFTIGIGYKNDFSSTSTFFSEIDYAKFKGDGGFDENGYQVTAGIRSMVSKQLELKAAVEYLDVDDEDSTTLVLGGAYSFSKEVAVYADYSHESDLDTIAVGVRYNF